LIYNTSGVGWVHHHLTQPFLFRVSERLKNRPYSNVVVADCLSSVFYGTLKDGCNGDDGELLNTCKVVGKRAFMQMWAFEGVEDLNAEFEKNKAAGSKGKAMTYNAVGIRVKDYKKSLVASGCDYNNIRLCVKQG
jgi:hypothetical protein